MNQKGFTTVEVLICFVIISVIMMSMFSTISAFNEKRIQESYRARIYEFKNGITNIIQEDMVKRGLTYAKVSDNEKTPGDPTGREVYVDLTFRDGVQKRLVVHQRFARSTYRIEGANQDDEFYIEYGTPKDAAAGVEGDMIRYELPNLGEIEGFYSEMNMTYIPVDSNGKCYSTLSRTTEVPCNIAKDFQINNVAINITNEQDPTADSHVLNIYIGFYHPNLGTKYAINIVSPIDYQTSSAEQNVGFDVDPSNPNSATAIYYP